MRWAIAFDWREFLLLAHELRHEREESKQRTAIGRAYYYVYNVALTEIQRLGYDPRTRMGAGGVHKNLWGWCVQHSNDDIVALGDSGNTLHARRIRADYKLQQSPAQDVQKQLDEARDFELLLAQIIKRPAPPPFP